MQPSQTPAPYVLHRTREYAAVLGRTRVLALSAGEIAEVGATLNQSIDRVNLSLGPGLLLGGLALGELKYMLRQHLACSGAACARPLRYEIRTVFLSPAISPLGECHRPPLKYIGETSGSDVSHALPPLREAERSMEYLRARAAKSAPRQRRCGCCRATPCSSPALRVSCRGPPLCGSLLPLPDSGNRLLISGAPPHPCR